MLAVPCYAQRVETEYQTIEGLFDMDNLADKMSIVHKTIFYRDEENRNDWHASEVYVKGKIRLGNKVVLSFTDNADLDESMGGELTYISPQQGIIIKYLHMTTGGTVKAVYDFYSYDVKLQNWYRYKRATYDQSTWDDFSVTFDYYDKVQKSLVGSKQRTILASFHDPMKQKETLESILHACSNGRYPQTYLDFVSYIEILNHVDITHCQVEIQELVALLKLHNEYWANYISSTYLRVHR
ncbi:hypothetical protein SAMN05216383_10343 [Prevotella sp. KH2C16]|nr:hypothetical protein SAMN05216383_10343 [Prevotella sp. KH2C16]